MDFDSISLTRLRLRKSEKWNTYPPHVLPAFVAEMDFDLAEPIRRALRDAIERNDCGYATAQDLPAAFGAFAARRFRADIPEERVFVVPDVMSGIAQAIRLFTRPGSSVVINPPVYPPYFEVIPYAGRAIVEVPLAKSDDDSSYHLNFDALERAFASGAQAYLLCTPHNPVGRVWSGDELRRLVALVRRYNVGLICDEIFGPLVMPDAEFSSIFALGEVSRCCAIASASKAWNIAGLKCAVVAASADVAGDLRTHLKSIPTEIDSRVGHLGVIATIAAFRECDAWLDELLAYLAGNREIFRDLLRERLPMLRYTPAQATYLAWVDCRALGVENPAKHFLTNGDVAVERGTRFGTGGNGYVRVNIGTSRAILEEIVRRMSSALVHA